MNDRRWLTTLVPYELQSLCRGIHYAQFRTPLQNVRLTTFFAGEGEVRVADPRLVCLVEAVGCRVA